MSNKRTRGNGQGTVFKLPSGKWRVEKSIFQNGRLVKRVTKSGFKMKRDAMAYLTKLNAGTIENAGTLTFAEMYEMWSAQHYPKVSYDTSNGYKAAYRHCEPLWFRTFSGIKAADLQAVVDSCNMSRRTKSDIKIMLSLLYKYAMENDYVDKDYSKFVRIPPKEKGKRDAFAAEELKKLWADYRSGNEFAGHILVMVYTGMRYGEYARLEKKMIDLEEKTIKGAGIKTEAGKNRIIPIADGIFSIIQDLYNKTEKKILTCHEKVFYNNFHVTLARLGIRPLTPHCCRHTFASMMAAANVPPAIISAAIGHETYSTTMQYTHIKIDELRKAVNMLPSSSSE